MSDAGNDLFKSIRAKLLADTYVVSQVGARVFSSWDNQGEAIPLIRMKITGTREFEIDEGGTGSEIDFWLYVFTTESAPIVCRQIASAARKALHQANLTLAGHDLVALDHRETRTLGNDQSPLLQTAILQFRAFTTEK